MPDERMGAAIVMAKDILTTRFMSTVFVEEGDWADEAACLEKDQSLFFAPDDTKITYTYYKEALAICGECPVAGECLAQALLEESLSAMDSIFGVRGGLLPRERIALARTWGLRERVLQPA